MDAEKPPYRAYRFDRFVLDLHRGALLVLDGTELPLRPKSFALLQLLVENAGRLLSRDTIMEAVWPDVFVTDDSISQCIYDIRRVLGDEGQRLLRTVPRRGYLFTVAVSHASLVKEAPGQGLQTFTTEPAAPTTPSGIGTVQDRYDEPEEPIAYPDPDPEVAPGLIRLGRQGTSPASGRRHLTVLACDLVNSTGLVERMDPEDAGAVMRTLLRRCAAVVTGCGGHVAAHTGDGLVAYFGYPHAHEDAAERSVRAGLALVEAVATLELGPDRPLQLRIGIATGLVVNDRIGEGDQGHLAVGRPLNLATRLQALAKPTAVVIADTTRRLLGGLFALEDLNCHTLKGFTAPMRVWRVIGEGTAESRFEALRGASLAPLVGRGHELSLLLDRWRQARTGEGQVVLLTGEPGIGKSRLIQALRDGLASEPNTYLGHYCSPVHQDSPLWPVITQFERAAGLSRSDDPAQKLAKLATLLAQGGDASARSVPLVASLLSIPNEACSPLLDMTPQQQRSRTLAALVDWLAGLTAHRPVLLVWEDVHWADPTSLELLGLVLDRLQDLPVLALVSFRPEFVPPWSRYTHATWLGLHRLGRRRCSRLIAGLSRSKALPPVVMDQIMAKAEGVPLFVEELTKAVLESRLLRDEGDRYELDGPLAPLAIPETLQDSLMARLDRHAPIKELAQIGAIIGREFSRELLAAVVSWEEKDLDEALRRLVAAELIFPRGVGSEATYVFKHALVRDAAYESLLRITRRRLHASIAEILESRYPTTAHASPEILAYHCTQGGLLEKGAGYWLQAGRRACEQSASVEAVSQLNEALDLFRQIPDSVEIRQQTLTVLMTMGPVLMTLHGPGSPKVKQVYDEALTLCSGLSYSPLHFTAYWGWWRSAPTFRLQRERADQLSVLAEDLRDPGLRLQVHHCQWATLFNLGNQQACCEHIEKGLEIYRSGDYQAHALLYGSHDPKVCGCAEHALALWLLGYPNRSFIHMSEALAWARHLSHSGSLLHAMDMSLILNFFRRDVQTVHEGAKALIKFADEHGFTDHWSKGIIFRGWAVGKLGDMPRGIKEMLDGIAIQEANGTQDDFPLYYDMIAELYGMAGQVELGLNLLDGALQVTEQTGHQYWEVELRRRYGELLLKSADNRDDMAEAYFRKALEIADQQKVKSLELRTAVSLARLWQGRRSPHEALRLLTPVYDWFGEGGETIDMTEARDLLDTCRE